MLTMQKTADNLMLNWRDHPPLTKVQAQLNDLAERLSDLDGKRATASARYDAARSSLTDLEAKKVLGRATAAEVAAADAELTTARNELATLDAAGLPVAHAKELLECEIPGLEAEGKALVQAAYHDQYRPAVARLLNAVKAASVANAEVERILRQAGVDFGDSFFSPLDAHFPSFLPNLLRLDLRLTPPNHMGECALALWEKSANEYIGGK
jgi:hypothetical protein